MCCCSETPDLMTYAVKKVLAKLLCFVYTNFDQGNHDVLIIGMLYYTDVMLQ